MRRFLRGLLIFLLGGIAGTALGFAAGIFFFPYLFPPPPANEQLSSFMPPQVQAQAPAEAQSSAPTQAPATAQPAPQAKAQPQPLSRGTFIHANPKDPVHWGRGSVAVYDNVVFLEQNFEVGPGPKYHVYLVPNASIRNEAGVKGSMFIDLGRLRAFKGSQGYQIPAGVDLAKYPSVVIWCEAFGVLISPADLKSAK
jgi:hypothetical protein